MTGRAAWCPKHNVFPSFLFYCCCFYNTWRAQLKESLLWPTWPEAGDIGALWAAAEEEAVASGGVVVAKRRKSQAKFISRHSARAENYKQKHSESSCLTRGKQKWFERRKPFVTWIMLCSFVEVEFCINHRVSKLLIDECFIVLKLKMDILSSIFFALIFCFLFEFMIDSIDWWACKRDLWSLVLSGQLEHNMVFVSKSHAI